MIRNISHSGAPGNLLTESAEQSGSPGWNYADVSPYAITGGTQYFIVVIADNDAVCEDRNVNAGTLYKSMSFSGLSSGMPATGGSSWMSWNSSLKVFGMDCI